MNKKLHLLAQAIHKIGKSTAPSTDMKLAAFLGITGHDYRGDLMVIGRATNGWDVEWNAREGSEWPCALQKAEEVFNASQGADGKCPMLWVSTQWGVNSSGYSTKKSAFWRCIRQLVGELGAADITQPSWPSVLMWTNLFKVSHSAGNPNIALQKQQLSFVKELLVEEIREALPRRILFLTGLAWAKEFLDALDATFDETSQFQQVQAAGILKSFDPGHQGHIRIVVATHPQGKPSQAWVAEVVSAFK
jgi:hypothetical protein